MNHFPKGVPKFLKGTGVAGREKPRQKYYTESSPSHQARESPPPTFPQLRQTQSGKGGKGEGGGAYSAAA